MHDTYNHHYPLQQQPLRCHNPYVFSTFHASLRDTSVVSILDIMRALQ